MAKPTMVAILICQSLERSPDSSAITATFMNSIGIPAGGVPAGAVAPFTVAGFVTGVLAPFQYAFEIRPLGSRTPGVRTPDSTYTSRQQLVMGGQRTIDFRLERGGRFEIHFIVNGRDLGWAPFEIVDLAETN
jgi:hypothetical protein